MKSRWRSVLQQGAFLFVFGGLLSLGINTSEAASTIPFVVSINTVEYAVAQGQSTTIQWSAVQGAAFPYTCSISRTDGSYLRAPWTISNESEDSGTFTTVPNVTTTYTLVCSDAAGVQKQDSDTVIVSTKPVASITTSTPSLPVEGGRASIGWQVALATSCDATDGTDEWRSVNDLEKGGSLSFSISRSTIFTIECFDSTGQTSGKKSVKVGVGEGNNICGNGIKESPEEECDNGAANSDSCPTSCTTSCQSYFCSDSLVDFTSDFDGANNDIEVCVGVDGYRDDVNLKPGATITYSWDAKNAISCSRDSSDRLETPFDQCFPAATPNAGPVNVPTKGSCTFQVPNLPQNSNQSFSILCTDGARSKEITEAFWIAKVSGSEAVCSRDEDQSGDIDITSFTASPNLVPFGYTGDVTFRWETVTEPVATPTCRLGYENSKGTWVTKGTPKQSSKGSITLPISEITTNTPEAGPGGKKMGIQCSVGEEEDEAETLIKFASDSTQAPQVSLTVGRGGRP